MIKEKLQKVKRMNELKKSQIEKFLKEVDVDFPTPLSQKQNLSFFAQKLIEKATICAKTENGKIVAMLAGYTENLTNNISYISILATSKQARGKGYAKGLLKEFIDICRSKKIKAIHLYTTHTNKTAVNIYKKAGFVEWAVENEPRKEDLHLIYYIEEN